jgi:basic membrane lipoprotein Med (substrate-binding protein (PBP1-ABC) superfamily)
MVLQHGLRATRTMHPSSTSLPRKEPMRAIHVVQAIAAAATLTLATVSMVAAQTEADTRFPTEMGPTLLTAVVTNALDANGANDRLTAAAREYQAALGGTTTPPAEPEEEPKKGADKEPPRGGFMTFAPFASTGAVTQAVLDLAGEFSPDLIVISGGDWKSNVGIARTNPSTTVIDINQPPPCLTENGQPDPSGECLGELGSVPGNYSAMEFAVEEGAYLAGVVAARESRDRPLGIISGSRECLECDRYVTGFINGARSVEPEIEIVLEYLANDEASGFNDAANAKTFAEAFVDVYEPSVLLPVGRGATMGMIEAACDAGVMVIGTGVNIRAERPDLSPCIMASIVPDTKRAVQEAMFYFSNGQGSPVITYDLNGGGVTVTDEWRTAPSKRVDTNDFYAEAEVAILTDQVEPCPEGCGVFLPEPEAEEAAAEEAATD